MGSGNIGTDLMIKLIRSEVLDLVALVGIDPASDGLAKARRLGIEAPHTGIDWVRAHASDIDLVFDATSAYGSHAVAHQYTLAQVTDIGAGLDAAGVPVIEVSHGDGLGGSSFIYGFSGTDEMALITRAVQTAKQPRIACLLLPGIGTADRIEALVGGLDIGVGMHAHENLSLSVAISLSALEAGATHIDGCTAGAGAGAGNCPTETLVTVCQKMGIETCMEALALMDVAEEIVRQALRRPQIVDRAALTLGLAGVYGSFMLHSERAAQRYGVSQAEILLELGRRKAVGGQEDMIIDVALELAARDEAARSAATREKAAQP